MPRYAYRCCVQGCSSKGEVSHRFPHPVHNMLYFKNWVDIIGGNLAELNPSIVYEKKRVCSFHFSEYDISPGTKKLKYKTVPTLNLPVVSLSVSCSRPSDSDDSKIKTDISDSPNTHVEPNLMSSDIADTLAFANSLDISGNDLLQSEYENIEDFDQSTYGIKDVKGNKSSVAAGNNIPCIRLNNNDQFFGLAGFQLLEDFEKDTPSYVSGVIGNTSVDAVKISEKNDGVGRKNELWKQKSKTKNSGLLSKTGISHKKLLTPKCKSLYADGLLLQKQLYRERTKCKTFKDRLKAAERVTEKFLDSKVMSHMTTSAAIFTKLQFRETRHSPKGRRFTLQEKLLSLSLYKQSAKSYRVLSKLFILPAKRTLSNLLSKIPINTGLDKTFLKVLNENVKKLKEKEKYVVVLFDEVSLEAQLHYDDNSGTIIGFEDNGLVRTNNFADHSLVFMIKGITKKFKQPISYTFCKSTTNRYDLANQIRTVLQAIHSTGLKIISTICDQGTTNTAALNILQNDTKAYYLRHNLTYDDYFYEVDCGSERIKIVHLYNPPHLLKGLRNNLLTKNLIFKINEQQKEARWKDLIDLYEMDSSIQDVKMLPRLTKEHIIPSQIKKMKVKNAAQVFSQRVSSILSFLASKNIVDPKAQDTAMLCLFFDKLFDSVNGSSEKIIDGKIYRTAIKRNSPHHILWTESLEVFKTMCFINQDTKQRSTPQPPTLKNWVKTIKGFQIIFKMLNSYGVKSVQLRNFNQDSLENFFGALRALGYRNNNPNCMMFASSYRTLLLNNLMSSHSPGSNCEAEESSCLTPYESLFAIYNNAAQSNSEIQEEDIVSDSTFKDKPVCNVQGINLGSQTKHFIAGYVIKKLNTVFLKNCHTCLTQLCTDTLTNDHLLIATRDYKVGGRYSLKYPNIAFCTLVQDIVDIIVQEIPLICYHKNFKTKLIKIINSTFNLNIITCPTHQSLFSNKFVNFLIKLIVHNWCTQINRLLSGSININSNEKDPIKIKAFSRYKTYSKKSKYVKKI